MVYTPDTGEASKLDVRIYIGMLFFRWQIITVCFLYSLLGGVLYLRFTPKEYVASCRVLRYQEGNIRVTKVVSPWTTFSSYVYLLQSDALRDRVVKRLQDEWGERMGSHGGMRLPVACRAGRAVGQTLDISVRTRDPKYGEAYLNALLAEHEPEWASMQKQASESAVKLIEKELARIEEKIRESEEELIEYQRLHDIARVDARGAMEANYLSALVGRRSMISTELMLMEHEYPMLKDASIGVISQVDQLTRETGAVAPLKEPAAAPSEKDDAIEDMTESLPKDTGVTSLPETFGKKEDTAASIDAGMGWQDLRVRLAQVEQKDRELAADLKPEHPQRRALAKELAAIKAQLDTAAKIRLGTLKDRYQALKIQLDAVEAAEYKWQAKNLYVSQRRAELKRVASVVGRFDQNYQALYSRLHDLKVSEELQSEHYHLLEPPKSSSSPAWPDPQKILLMALAVGLGAGFGIALVLQLMDNKIQSIKDVEKELGIPFIGGVPFWVHSGLEKAIRPIVTEERATGAIEAYRALRTSIISALRKVNEKIVFVTSADSREGKTLTSLNLAIMVAEMGKKVLLIDMDLRRGRLHRSLGLEREPGVTDALLQRCSLRDVIRSTRVEGLALAPAGSGVDNSAELLQSSDLVSMLVAVQDDYEYIIVDTSPVLRVTDTVIVATQGLGVVLYVARVNHTPKPLIRYSLDMLGDARILGLIMNSIEMHKISSLYYTYQYPNYAYYSNAYAYGYNYYHYDHTGDGKRHRIQRVSLGRRLNRAAQWFRRTFLPLD